MSGFTIACILGNNKSSTITTTLKRKNSDNDGDDDDDDENDDDDDDEYQSNKRQTTRSKKVFPYFFCFLIEMSFQLCFLFLYTHIHSRYNKNFINII